jgi:general secretion pathway protein M
MSGMATLKSKFNEFYQSKSESEQRLLLIFGIAVSLFLIISIYSKVATGLTDTQSKLDKQLELNQWASQQISTIQSASGASGRATSQASITQQINISARRHKVTIARMQPQKEGSVRVGLEDIPFNALLNWLVDLENKYGIKVTNIDFNRTDVSGVVKVRRLDLERL